MVGAGVSVLLNMGGSGFSNDYNYVYPKISPTASIVAADFNQDGHADIAIDDRYTVSILSGNGDGSLGGTTNYTKQYGYGSTAIATADFNGDGKPDLAVTGSVLLGNALGGFIQKSYSATPYSSGIVVTDLNGDSKPDIATAQGNTLSVVLGNGDGTFKPNINYPGTSATLLVAADFNGDQHSDLVAVNNWDNTYSMFLGDGNGNIASPDTRRGIYNIGSYPFDEIVADLNGDGFLDIASIVQFNDGNGISVLSGKGNGAFGPQAQHYPMVAGWSVQPTALAVGDLNHDGRSDLITVNKHWSSGDGKSDTFSVLIAKSGSAYRTQVDYPLTMTPWAVAVVDLNGDGKLDLAIAGDNGSRHQISVLPGNGDGTFQAGTDYPVTFISDLAIADLNQDNHPDLVSAGCDWTAYNAPFACIGLLGNSWGISALLGNGTGGFSSAPDHIVFNGIDELGELVGLAAGDISGDGKPDLVTCGRYFLGNGDGSFQTQQASFGACGSVSIADVDIDGKLDLVSADPSNNTVSVLLGKGDGTFMDKQGFGVGHSPSDVVVGDLNGDGKPDVATVNNASDSVSVLMNHTTLPNDLVLDLGVSGSIKMGRSLAYLVFVRNESDTPTNGVKVVAQLGNLATYSRIPDFCSITGQTLVCRLGTLVPRVNQRFTIDVMPSATGKLTLKAWILGQETDSNSSNNTVKVSTQVK